MRITQMQFEGDQAQAGAPAWIAAHHLDLHGPSGSPAQQPAHSLATGRRRVSSLAIGIDRPLPAPGNAIRLGFEGGFQLRFDELAHGGDAVAPSSGPPLDHVTVCVYPQNLAAYASQLRGQLPAARCEHHEIGSGDSGMRIAAVSDQQSGLQVVFAAPLGPRGQVADFLARTGCEGLQHVAFSVDSVRKTLGVLRDRGLRFVGATSEDPGQAVIELQERQRWLRQAFTEPLWGEFFIEIIERNGIAGLHPRNINALYDMNELAASAAISAAPALHASG